MCKYRVDLVKCTQSTQKIWIKKQNRVDLTVKLGESNTKIINSKDESRTPDKIVSNPPFLAQPLGLNLKKKKTRGISFDHP